jgi:hypothetical protein
LPIWHNASSKKVESKEIANKIADLYAPMRPMPLAASWAPDSES